MLKRKALMESVSSNLHNFLKKIGKNLSVPDKKFLRDSLIGLIRCGKPIVCQMARHLPNQRTKFLSRLDRLEANLGKGSKFDSKLKAELPEFWLPFIQDDTPIILDLSDIAKPFAKEDGLSGYSSRWQQRAISKWLLVSRIVCITES